MEKQSVGMEFCETMAGGFALGEVDPRRGKRQGTLQGTALSIHNEIAITDLDRFYQDPEHAATLGGSLDFTPFGDKIPIKSGKFNLFKMSGEDRVKLMVYSFGFEWDGSPYFFEGKKFIHEGSSILKLWKETTHLYALLYRGSDQTGSVVGAGVLDIGIREIIDLVRSMRVTGATSAVQRADALAHFGKFFFGELWDTYRGHARGAAG